MNALASSAGTPDAVSVVLDWWFAAKWDTYIGTLYWRLNGVWIAVSWRKTTGRPRVACAFVGKGAVFTPSDTNLNFSADDRITQTRFDGATGGRC
jgi:hypothetical protein